MTDEQLINELRERVAVLEERTRKIDTIENDVKAILGKLAELSGGKKAMLGLFAVLGGAVTVITGLFSGRLHWG